MFWMRPRAPDDGCHADARNRLKAPASLACTVLRVNAAFEATDLLLQCRELIDEHLQRLLHRGEQLIRLVGLAYDGE